MRFGRPRTLATGYLTIDALDALLAQRRTVELSKRAALALAQIRLDKAQQQLTRLETDFARACRDVARTGTAFAANLECAVEAARSAVVFCRDETGELRAQALMAMRRRQAAEALKARRVADAAAREARKEERELEEANQA